MRPPASAPKPLRPEPRRAADPVTPAQDALAARFAQDLAPLIDGALSAARIGLAVSGGPDSMAMLWLAHRALPGQIAAATIDHGLRAGSADEAQMVAGWCAAHAIPHIILTPETPITGSVQAAARAVRYALLDSWRQRLGLDHVLTAHHADDQAETLVMRLNRGAGVGGLAGVRARQQWRVRPLLQWRRSELQAVVAMASLPHCTDPSNDDPRFDRTRVRRSLSASPDLIDVAAAARSAANLSDADAALEWAAHQTIALWPNPNNPAELWVADYPPEILRRVLRIRLALHPGYCALGGAEMDRLVAAIKARRRASTGLLLVSPDRRRPGRWTIDAADIGERGRQAAVAAPSGDHAAAAPPDKIGNNGC